MSSFRPLLLGLILFFTTRSWAYASQQTQQSWIRDYKKRLYYTLYTPHADSKAAFLVAQHMEVRFEGQVGELPNYYWISTPIPNNRTKRDSSNDHIVARFNQLKSQVTGSAKRDVYVEALRRIDRLDPQVPRRRLFKRSALPIDRRQAPEDIFRDAPVEENILEEMEENGEFSTNIMLDLPGGYESFKERLKIRDPGFDKQWHIINRDHRGHDINVAGVWSQNITGQNVVVAILDDGLDMDNEDLKDNFFAPGSYDFNDHTNLPKPKLFDDTHGTRCAGEIAAVKNDVCGVGMAYGAKVAGIRILSADITEADEAAALNYKFQQNDIYSCSWGPPDQGEVAEAPKGIVLDAIKNGINNGRDGSGTIFVFASGNGGANDDNCNFDGYTNSLYTITVGAIDRLDRHPYYAESCSAQLIVTYSSGNGGHIYTTDVGGNSCSDRHGGTSAAAPLAAGVFALVLSVRPDLTWRDMQHLCVRTAVPVTLEDDDWDVLPSGRKYNHKFGYGKLDAFAIVEAAKNFKSVGPHTFLETSAGLLEKRIIPDLTDFKNGIDVSKALTSVVAIDQERLDSVGLGTLEHVTVTVDIEHGRRGDLEVFLESPNKVVSKLGASRKFDNSKDGLVNWTFMSVKHWEENPVGDWTLRVMDIKNPQYTGSLIQWSLTLWGETKFGFIPISILPISSETDHGQEQSTETPLSTGIAEDDYTSILPTPTPTAEIATDIPDSTIKEGGWETDSLGPDGFYAHEEDQETERLTPVYMFGSLLLVVCGVIGMYLLIRKWRDSSKSAVDTTAYVSAPQTDGDQYEFDRIRNGRRLERVSEEPEDSEEPDEGSGSSRSGSPGQPGIVVQKRQQKVEPKGKGRMFQSKDYEDV
ncbi:peptidase S8/S53 domain-containing protein [Phycomyces blakesleeanus]|uniref:Peptidase S8/S53 domain-containing protein n=2 Tax=Phycomyces blakesleeanus TaxID=4837 RepID=A0ABR3AN60_PHYBL